MIETRLGRRVRKRVKSPRQIILIVESDNDIASRLVAYLSLQDFSVLTVRDGSGMWQVLRHTKPSVIVVDVDLLDSYGSGLRRNLLKGLVIPVIGLTEAGSSDVGRVGCGPVPDRLLTKPVVPHELLTRIRTLLCPDHDGEAGRLANSARVSFAGWTLDLMDQHLVSPYNVVVLLSLAEYRLLHLLLEYADGVIYLHHLNRVMLERGTSWSNSSPEIEIARIRRKLGDDRAGRVGPALIAEQPDGGYLFTAPVTAEPAPARPRVPSLTYPKDPAHAHSSPTRPGRIFDWHL